MDGEGAAFALCALFHYGATIEHCMQEWAPDDLFLKELYGAYGEEHEAANADYVSQTPWSCWLLRFGEAVRTDIRQAWREHKDEMAVLATHFSTATYFFNLRLHVYPVTIRERSSILWNGCQRAAGGRRWRPDAESPSKAAEK